MEAAEVMKPSTPGKSLSLSLSFSLSHTHTHTHTRSHASYSTHTHDVPSQYHRFNLEGDLLFSCGKVRE
jgi:hypothetical protein